MVNKLSYEERLLRHEAIKILVKNGYTYKWIAGLYGISPSCVSYSHTEKPKKPKIKSSREIIRTPIDRALTLGKFYADFSKMGGKDRTRELVRIRDNHTCQMCGKKWRKNKSFPMRRFDVHHLNGVCGKKSMAYDKVSEMDGLITLCHKCHFNHPEHSRKLKKLAIKLS